MPVQKLPVEFAGLENWVDEWALTNERERNAKRLRSSIAELNALYDAVVPYGEAAMEYLAKYPAVLGSVQEHEIPVEARNLAYLLHMFGEVAPCVDLYGGPTVPNGFDSSRFKPEHDQPEWEISRD